jgi:hypothetical protein
VPPFKTGAERSFHKNGFSNEKVVGVGTYDVNKSYPWRKKEFNALYINNNNNTNINNYIHYIVLFGRTTPRGAYI